VNYEALGIALIFLALAMFGACLAHWFGIWGLFAGGAVGMFAIGVFFVRYAAE
jgi:hypothetical protein